MAHIKDRRWDRDPVTGERVRSDYTGDKPWRVRYRDSAGRTRSQSFAREHEAKKFRAKLEVEQTRGDWIDPKLGQLTLEGWVEQYRSTRTGLRPSSIARDESYLKNHVLPAFGRTPIAKIDNLGVRKWISELEQKELAPATVHKVFQTLSKVLTSAVDAGLLSASPCARVPLPRIEREEMRFLTPAEVAKLADTIDERFRMLVLLGAWAGLRKGEMLGLRKSRVDLINRRVDIAEILVEVKGHFHFGPPKTRAGRRSVPIPRFVAEELAALLAEKAADDLVLTGPEGGPMRASLFRTRHWEPAVKESKLAPLRIHDLRHTAVAMWIAAGASPKEIAARAGHTSVVTVLDRYGHLLPGSEDRVTDALDAMADEAANSRAGKNET